MFFYVCTTSTASTEIKTHTPLSSLQPRLNLCLSARKWRHQFDTALLSIILCICSLPSLSLKWFVSAGRETHILTHTHKSYRHNGGVNTHCCVVLMVVFCWRGDWIRRGADCSVHWLMLPAVAQCVVALWDLLLNANETKHTGTVRAQTTVHILTGAGCHFI